MLTMDGKGTRDVEPGARSVREHEPARRRSRCATRPRANGRARSSQVQRLANPLVNEVIIGTKDKDHWNATDPRTRRSSSTTT